MLVAGVVHMKWVKSGSLAQKSLLPCLDACFMIWLLTVNTIVYNLEFRDTAVKDAFCKCACVHVCSCHGAHVGLIEQLSGVSFLHPGCQA